MSGVKGRAGANPPPPDRRGRGAGWVAIKGRRRLSRLPRPPPRSPLARAAPRPGREGEGSGRRGSGGGGGRRAAPACSSAAPPPAPRGEPGSPPAAAAAAGSSRPRRRRRTRSGLWRGRTGGRTDGRARGPGGSRLRRRLRLDGEEAAAAGDPTRRLGPCAPLLSPWSLALGGPAGRRLASARGDGVARSPEPEPPLLARPRGVRLPA